ncbi:hypothetical protein RFI_12656 [Reticulomyxa filosa]|uniref:Proteasome activator PA28 C-terminal domain-containing protein n=1 Tax=Reticulomyxa filosa TaxID=46433 RepID=X6NDV3_RETFI|nr:hypothetical protein RFI_12656 [Reticulomyxa filosa]|eukprot:ETO24500.1 hypothetical protein RFI_12656 [Reticulomyxa filosa]
MSQTQALKNLLDETYESGDIITISSFKSLSKRDQKEKLEETNKKIEELKKFTKKKADDIVYKILPEKVKILEKLLKEINEKFKQQQSKPCIVNVNEAGDDMSAATAPPTKKQKKSNERPKEQSVTQYFRYSKHTEEERRRLQSENECNPLLAPIIEKVNDEINDAWEVANDLKLSIFLSVPDMQEENNFGVEVQKHVLDALIEFEKASQTCLDTLSSYFVDRSKYITDICKHPHISSFRYALIAFDLSQFVQLKCVSELVIVHSHNFFYVPFFLPLLSQFRTFSIKTQKSFFPLTIKQKNNKKKAVLSFLVALELFFCCSARKFSLGKTKQSKNNPKDLSQLKDNNNMNKNVNMIKISFPACAFTKNEKKK